MLVLKFDKICAITKSFLFGLLWSFLVVFLDIEIFLLNLIQKVCLIFFFSAENSLSQTLRPSPENSWGSKTLKTWRKTTTQFVVLQNFGVGIWFYENLVYLVDFFCSNPCVCEMMDKKSYLLFIHKFYCLWIFDQ